ncbi:DsbA family protein [Haloferacaceae archaeon DSL9]
MQRKSTRRTFIAAAGSATLLGAVGAGTASASDPVSNAPVTAESSTYPTMGTDPNNPTIAFFGNFKCPYTRQAVTGGNLDAVVSEFVASGRANIEFRTLAFKPSSSPGTPYINSNGTLVSQAARGVWREDPDNFWAFFRHMFETFPGHSSLDELISIMDDVGVNNLSTIRSGVNNNAYLDPLYDSAELANDHGITYVPEMELDGDTTNPRHGRSSLLSWIDSRVDDAEPEPEPEPETETEPEADEADEEEVETEDTAASVEDSRGRPLPNPDDQTYPTVGTDEDNPTVTLVGNFNCPYTRQVITQSDLFDELYRNFIQEGRVNLEFRSLAYNPYNQRSNRITSNDETVSQAALAVWDEDPERYWSFFYQLASDIPRNADLDDLESIMESTGVQNTDAIREQVADDEYTDELSETADYARSAGLSYIPVLEFNGSRTSARKGDVTSWLENRL